MKQLRMLITLILVGPILLISKPTPATLYAGDSDLEDRFNDSARVLSSQNIVSHWEGTLTPDPSNRLGAKSPVEALPIHFDITYDDNNVPIHFDYEFTATHATESEEEGVVCFNGGQVTEGRRAEIFGPLIEGAFLVSDQLVVPGNFYEGWALQGATVINNENGVVPDQATGAILLYYDIQFGSITCKFNFNATCATNCIAGPAKLSLGQSAYMVREDDEKVSITVNRSGNQDEAVQVDFATNNGTALAGQDYTSKSETLAFAANETSKTIDVDIDANLEIEGEETFNITLMNPTNGAELGPVNMATVTIDDRPDLTIDPFTLPIENLQQNGSTFILPGITVVARNLAEDGPALTGAVVKFTAGETVVHEEMIAELDAGDTSTFNFDWDVTALLVASGGDLDLSLLGKIDPANIYEETNEGNNTQTATGSLNLQPKVVGVTPQYALDGHYFLDNQSVTNEVMVMVDWNGDLPGNGSDPGEVHFKLNGVEVTKAGTATGASHSYDMGSEFTSSLSCANNTLEIWASKSGINSNSFVTQPTVFPYPEWVEWVIQNIPGSAGDFSTTPKAPLVEYAYEFKYPDPAFEAIWDVPTIVPYLGGKKIGILESQAMANALAKSDGNGEVGLTGMTGLGLAAVDLAGSIGGIGAVKFTCGESLDLLSTTLTLNVNATFSREMGLAELFPPLAAAEDWWAVGGLVAWLNQSAEVSASLTPEVEIETTFVDNAADELEFETGSGTGTIGAEASLTVNPISGVEASVTGGGSPYVTVQVPANPSYLQEVGINLSFEAALTVLGLGYDYTTEVNCNSNGGCSVDDDNLRTATSDPTLIPRDYAKIATYDTFAPTLKMASNEITLLTNIYPYPQPSLTIRADGQRLLAAIHDDSSAPIGRGTELRVLHYDGDSWQAPVNITSDAQPDFNPSVTFDNSGNGLVIWERATLTAGISPTLNFTYTNSFEIYSSIWTGTSWSTPTALTSNALLDYVPQAAAGNDGTVMATWQTNDGADMMGTVAHPVTINMAKWNGTTWVDIAPILTGQTGVIQSKLAINSATEASLVLTKLDGDTELYYTTYNGTAWSGLTQITTNTVADDAPQLIYDSLGNRHLIWRQNGQLRWLKNSWDMAQAQIILANNTDGGLLEIQLTTDTSGNLALLWPALGETTPDLMGMVYDGTTDRWSTVQRLTKSSPVEGSLAASFDPDGALTVGYRSTARVYGNASNGAANVPTLGASDLAFLSHPLGRDLVIETVTISPTNPPPSSSATVTAVMHNSGDLTVVAPQLQFLDGSAILATQTLSDLDAGMTITSTLAWNVSATTSSHTLKAVADPNGQVVEIDEGNNEAQISTTLPDITFDLAYTVYGNDGVTMTLKMRNQGVLATATAFDVALRAGNPVSGTLLGSVTVPTLTAGEAVTIGHHLAASALMSLNIDRLWAVADSAATIMEANEGNNVTIAPLKLLPDLKLAAEDIKGGAGVIAITVHNQGYATANDVLLWQASGSDLPAAGNTDNTNTIATIPAGESRVIQITVPATRTIHAISIDPENTIAEISESNNVAKRTVSVTNPQTDVYLPILQRP